MKSLTSGFMAEPDCANNGLVLGEAYGCDTGYRLPPTADYSVLSQGAVDWYHSCFVYCWLGLRLLGKTCP